MGNNGSCDYRVMLGKILNMLGKIFCRKRWIWGTPKRRFLQYLTLYLWDKSSTHYRWTTKLSQVLTSDGVIYIVIYTYATFNIYYYCIDIIHLFYHKFSHLSEAWSRVLRKNIRLDLRSWYRDLCIHLYLTGRMDVL